ncbi:MAG: hypothetical protein GY783_12490 [Gammaproteobacteria bacterium]|nr:hypothetical protein [Gammaproteobacteria bacterium]MCP4982278.1 hypothetical protein [Gammaproteobacteria bacterium]
MFHMISCFNLKPGEDIESFRFAYACFVDEMKRVDLVESSGPVGRRQNDTPMDTDDARDHQYFAVMSFRDRVQVDAAYDHIMQHVGTTDDAHDAVYMRVLDPVFICWQDLP